MQKVKRGSSDIEVSALCFGMDLLAERSIGETSFRLADLFHQSGGTFVDTMNFSASSDRRMRYQAGLIL